LRKAQADAFALVALDRAIGIEETAQDAAHERGAPAFDLRRQCLGAGAHPPRVREIAQSRRAETRLPAARDRPLEAAEIGAVGEWRHGGLDGRHDPRRAGARPRDRGVADAAKLGRPHREHRLFIPQPAVADQEAEEVAVALAALALPFRQLTMVVQGDLVARMQRRCRHPFELACIPGHPSHAMDEMIGCESQRIALAGDEPHDRTRAGPEESVAFDAMRASLHDRVEPASDQLAHLPRAVTRHHPRIGRDARIGRVDRLAIR
jgi:hypothetical protein